MKNPFKFGSIVDTPYFIDRQEEIERVKSYLASENHLIIISPRRSQKHRHSPQIFQKIILMAQQVQFLAVSKG